MDSKIFNIPFRSRSKDSDFICKDGEIESGTVGGSESEKVGGLKDNVIAPKPDISFAIVRDTLKGWHVNPDIYPSKTSL